MDPKIILIKGCKRICVEMNNKIRKRVAGDTRGRFLGKSTENKVSNS